MKTYWSIVGALVVIAAALVFFPTYIHCQTTEHSTAVVALSDEDATSIKALYDKLTTLNAAILKKESELREKYLTDPVLSTDKKNWRSYKVDFANGLFQYSKDFKYLLPVTVLGGTGGNWNSCYSKEYGCSYCWTPNVGGLITGEAKTNGGDILQYNDGSLHWNGVGANK